MLKNEYIDYASNACFISGAVFAKLHLLPLPFIPVITNIISLTLYLCGYSLWMFKTNYYPEHEKKGTQWYGFAQFKVQHLFSGIVGFIATAVAIGSLFLPILFIPASWLYFGSNIIWCISEYHMLKNPAPQGPNEDPFSLDKQNSYVKYVLHIASISFISAAAATVALCLPPLAISALIISSTLIAAIGFQAINHLLDYTYGPERIEIIEVNETSKISPPLKALRAKVRQDNTESVSPSASCAFLSFFKTPNKTQNENGLDTPKIHYISNAALNFQ